MGRKRLVQELYVYMNGRRVGSLQRQLSGMLKFMYHPEWLGWENARPISLSMPLSEIIYDGIAVYNFFDNLLPDSESIRKRIQARFGAETNNCFDLLTYIGADCVGAIQLLTEPKLIDIRQIEANPMDNKSIAALLKRYQTAPLGMEMDSEFRLSIAGAQEKTALLWYQNQWYQPKGVTPTTHIIKLPIGYIKHTGIDLTESVGNEWLCLQILTAYGLSVNRASISSFEDVNVLVVERFDRQWAKNGDWIIRLPQEDMCQALGKSSALKYESDGGPGIEHIMSMLKGSINAKADRETFMKSVFLFWVLGAIDGHAKNFSIKLATSGRFELAPLYDVLSAYPIVNQHQLELKKLKMAMSLKGKNRHYLWNDFQIRHWLEMAHRCQFSDLSMNTIIEEVFDSMEQVITKVEHLLPHDFKLEISNSIFVGMRKVKNKAAL